MPFTKSKCIRFMLAAVLLHNFLRQKEIEENQEPPEVELQNQDNYEGRRIRAPNPTNSAKIYRDRYVEYFVRHPL